MTSLKIPKGACRSRESKKNKQRLNKQKTNNSPQSTTQKTKTNHESHELHQKTEDELRCSERRVIYACSAGGIWSASVVLKSSGNSRRGKRTRFGYVKQNISVALRNSDILYQFTKSWWRSWKLSKWWLQLNHKEPLV